MRIHVSARDSAARVKYVMALAGVGSAIYTIPKPFGEIYSWRFYCRDQEASRHHALAYEWFSKAALHLRVPRKTSCTVQFYTTEKYVLQKRARDDNYVLEGVAQGGPTALMENDWIQLEPLVPFAEDFETPLPLMQIAALSFRPTTGQQLLILKPPVCSVFVDTLDKFLSDNPDNSQVQIHKVRCEISPDEPWGWTGDVRDIHVKNNNADAAKWYLQIVCIDAQSARDATKQDGFARMASSQWASLQAVKQAMATAADGLVEKLTTEYNSALMTRFKAYMDEVQEKMDMRCKNTFAPIDGNRQGGYILLRSVRTLPESTEFGPEARLKRVKLQTADGNAALHCSLEPSMPPEPPRDLEFELVAGSLQSDRGDLLSNPCPQIGVAAADVSTLFAVQEAPPQSSATNYRFPEKQLRLRTHLTEKNEELTNVLQDMQAYDKPAMPFEHDLHMNSKEQFDQEFKSCLHLVLQSIIATTHGQSFEEQAKAFACSPVRGIREQTTLVQYGNQRIVAPPSPVETSLALYAFNIRGKHERLEQLINTHDPWVGFDDNERGACASLLWQPCVDQAIGLREKGPDTHTIERFLASLYPYGNIGAPQKELVQNVLKRVMDLYTREIAENYIMLEQTSPDTVAPEYTPLVLHYGTTIADNFETLTWSLGGSASLVIESLEICMLFLQKILHLQNTDSNTNSIATIQSREKEAGMDTYPLGLAPVANAYPGDKTFYETRDHALKEVQYRDTPFSIQGIQSLKESMDMHAPSANKWTGFYGMVDDPQSPYAGNLLVAQRTDTDTEGAPQWQANPMSTEIAFTGLGAWTGTTPPRLSQLVDHRYRNYTGKRPNVAITSQELESDAWQREATQYVGPSFDATEDAVKIVHPAIEMDSLLKTVLPEFLVTNFVGWHYSNERALGRTVFARACGKFQTKIVEFFNKTDSYGEELAISLEGPRAAEASFLHHLMLNTPKRTHKEFSVGPVVPALIEVRGAGNNSLTTLCEVHGFYAKTSIYRMLESEVAGTIQNTLMELRRLPGNALPNCLGYQLWHCDRYKKQKISNRKLLEMRPSCKMALVRLMISTLVYDSVRRNNETFRERPSINAGTFFLFTIKNICVSSFFAVYTGLQDIRTSVFEVLFRT